MKTLVAVTAVITRNNNVLFIKQNKVGGAYPDTLHLPGGRLEQDENPDEGVLREIKEEVGIEVTNLKPAGFTWDVIPYKGETVRFIYLRFTAELTDGEPVAGSDAAEVIWVPKTELASANLNRPTKQLFAELGIL